MVSNVYNQHLSTFLNSVWLLLPILFYFHIYILIVFYKQVFFFLPKWRRKKKNVQEKPSEEDLWKIKEKVKGEMEKFLEENDEEVFDSCYGSNFPNNDPEDDKRTWWERNKKWVVEVTVWGLFAALTIFLFTFKPKPGDSPGNPGISLEIFDNTDIQESPFQSYEQEQEYHRFRSEFYAFSEQIANFYSLVDSNQIAVSDIPEAIKKSEQTIRDIQIQLGSGANEFLRYEIFRNFLLNPTTKEASLNMAQISDFLSSEYVETTPPANSDNNG